MKRKAALVLATVILTLAMAGTAALSATPMTPPWYEVIVTQAGLAQGATTPSYIVILTDVGGAFTDRWFKVDASIAGPVLDAARTSIASGNHARVYLPSAAAGAPVQRFYLMEGGIDLLDYSPPNVTKNYALKSYQGGAVQSETTVQISSFFLRDGTLEERWLYEGGAFDVWIFSMTEDGRAGTGYKKYDADGMLITEFVYDKAVVWQTPAGVKKVGDSWGEGFVTTQNSFDPEGAIVGTSVRPSAHQVTILGFEDVTVPAGTFADCVKLYRHGGSAGDVVLWYAKGIGNVRRIYSNPAAPGGGQVYELTSYSR